MVFAMVLIQGLIPAMLILVALWALFSCVLLPMVPLACPPDIISPAYTVHQVAGPGGALQQCLE